MKLSGLIIETSPVHSTKSARPLSVVKFVFLCDNVHNVRMRAYCVTGALAAGFSFFAIESLPNLCFAGPLSLRPC